MEDALKTYKANRCNALNAIGGGCVNDCVIHLATSNMGFGGVGKSGMGSYHGKTGFDAFSHNSLFWTRRLGWSCLCAISRTGVAFTESCYIYF